jgi:hypothetical protein
MGDVGAWGESTPRFKRRLVFLNNLFHLRSFGDNYSNDIPQAVHFTLPDSLSVCETSHASCTYVALNAHTGRILVQSLAAYLGSTEFL